MDFTGSAAWPDSTSIQINVPCAFEDLNLFNGQGGLKVSFKGKCDMFFGYQNILYSVHKISDVWG